MILHVVPSPVRFLNLCHHFVTGILETSLKLSYFVLNNAIRGGQLVIVSNGEKACFLRLQFVTERGIETHIPKLKFYMINWF